jgi:hypothetical protein
MTREEIIDMAEICFVKSKNQIEFIELFANLVAQHEREACVNVADKFAQSSQYKTHRNLAELVASAIKARGQA